MRRSPPARRQPDLVTELGAAGGRPELDPIPERADGPRFVAAKDGVLARAHPLERILAPAEGHSEDPRFARPLHDAVAEALVGEDHGGKADGMPLSCPRTSATFRQEGPHSTMHPRGNE
jgi:hypothetical protein